jgi:CzcA family heavy metal efflux pump
MQRHRRSLLFLALMLAIGGIASALLMPVALFPNVAFPRVQVSLDAGDRPADQMAIEVTTPVEEAIRHVRGVRDVRSTTSRGSAEVAVTFDWGADMAAALQEVNAAAGQILPQLPAGTQLSTRRMDPTTFPVLAYSLRSHTQSPSALHDLAEYQLRPLLSGISGVAQVQVQGGEVAEFHADVDPGKLRALQLSLADVATAVGHAATIQAMGRVADHYKLYLLLADNQPKTLAALRGIVLRAGPGGAVRLGDVAAVSLDHVPQWIRVNADGQDAVLLQIYQQPDGNSVQIANDVKQRLADYAPQMPAGVRIANWYDQTQLVTGAAASVRDAILIGVLLAGLVLFVFLRNTRVILVALIVVPAVLAITVLLLSVLGMSFNMMTLGGMAAAVGLVVDDAVVMLEHVMRRMQEGSAKSPPRLLDAAAEMARPLFGSTLATIIVFLPLAFVSGVTGGFFKALAVTMVAALAVSLVYARYVIPLIASTWLRDKDAEAAERAGGVMARLGGWYSRASDRTLARPALFAGVVTIGVALIGWVSWSHVPSGFMPAMDEGGFVLDYTAQPGASLADTDRLLRQVEQIIRATPEVASYSRRTGLQLGGGLTEADEGDYFIRLKSGSRRPIEAVMADIRQQIAAKVPGLDVELIQLMEDLIGDLTAVPEPIEVKLFGEDNAALTDAAGKVGAALGKIDGVVGVVDGLRVAVDAVIVHIDPGAAAQQGLDPDAVSSQIEALIGGSVATQVRTGEQLIDVRVRAPAALRERTDQIAELPITAPDGHSVRLGSIARVSIDPGQKQLTREDLAPFIAVTARLEGRDLGSGMRDVRAAVAALHLPASVRVDYGGLYAEQQKSFADLSLVFAAAVLLIALLLTFLFERIIWTVAALATILLAAAAVFAGLWLTGIELNISALMGLTMVAGMVTELVIFFLAEIDRDAPLTLAALHEAGSNRLRPILMSALIAILTLSPLALSISRGAGLQQPLATAIIFGLIAAVPLVLLFLPAAVYALTALHERSRSTT